MMGTATPGGIMGGPHAFAPGSAAAGGSAAAAAQQQQQHLEVVGQRVRLEPLPTDAVDPTATASAPPAPAPVSWYAPIGRSPTRSRVVTVGPGGGVRPGSAGGAAVAAKLAAAAPPPAAAHDPSFGRGGVLEDMILVGADGDGDDLDGGDL
jgi:hypothetical protein